MSAFLESGRSIDLINAEMTVRFRPEADLLTSTKKPRTRRGFKKCLAIQGRFTSEILLTQNSLLPEEYPSRP
jgi:hypothetical protein